MCFNEKDLARVMEKAAEVGMTGPEYVYIWYDDTTTIYNDQPWVHLQDKRTPEELVLVKESLYAMKQVLYM